MKDLVKVTAYITRKRRDCAQLLLCLEEGMESFGLQVPGGTLEPPETLEDCLLREIREEAALTNVRLAQYLGQTRYFFEKKQRYVTRHYYHLTISECADTFTHIVQSQDEDNGWIYHYHWLDLTDVVLGGTLGEYLTKLRRILIQNDKGT